MEGSIFVCATPYHAYEGKTCCRWFHLEEPGDYELHFRILSTNAAYRQGIALFYSSFQGKTFLNGNQLPVLKGRFQHYVFKENEISNREMVLKVHMESGKLVFTPASETAGGHGFECGAFGSGFWMEQVCSQVYRFHCNCHGPNRTFDNLVFDVEVI